jgi:hypothetical protein
VVTPDPRWLEILKASGWQTAGIAAACGVFLWLAHAGSFGQVDPLFSQLVAFAGLVTGFLALASLITAILKFFPAQKWFLLWYNLRRAKRAVRDYIPHMTEKEREIIGYLLAKNQKMFGAASDGGYASTLLSRGIVRVAARQGQHIDMMDVPMEIPDYVWEVLSAHRDQFPYTPRGTRNGVEPHPWRVPMF